MTRACWRTMACLLAVGLGGLVVWADDPPKPEPKTYEREAQGVKAPEPVAQVVTDIAPNPPPVVVPAPIKPDPDAVVLPRIDAVPPPAPALAPPPVVVPPLPPAPAVEPPPPAPPVRAVPPLPSAPALAPPPCGEKACFDKPEMARAEPDPPTRPLTPPAPPIINVTRGTVVQAVPAVNSAVPPMPAASVTPAPHSMSPFPWKVCLEFVNGQTQAEVRRGDELLLRIQCEKMDLSTPSTGLHAVGKVLVSGPCLEARCEKISIAWHSGQVALDGSVFLSFQNKGVVQVMRAESLCFRLTGASVPVEFTARDVHQMVAPR